MLLLGIIIKQESCLNLEANITQRKRDPIESKIKFIHKAEGEKMSTN